ncbi:hypothetical protein F5883DRAFT_540606 [Diaporthe sp. PMI_573]|nr:hypothetical protein F5883DRAFT_540606 [Diaporthaceae sp. PMI_573]
MSQCGFDGNPDIYGLGVRLGAYLSWVSITIASTFFPSARKDLLDALVIFSIAFFAAIILESLDDETYTVELIIMGYIFFGGIVTTSISLGQDVTLGDLPGASNLDSNSAVGQAIGSSRNSSADVGSTHPEIGIFTEALPVVTSRTPAYRANPSLWRGVVLVLCVVGMEAHTFWLYWFADPFRETPCGTWVFPWATLHDNSLRHGSIMVFGLLSFVTFPMVLTALLGIVLFGPDFLAILQAVVLRKRAKSVEERGFQSYNKRIYFLAQRLRWLSRDIKKSWPKTVLKPLLIVASVLAFVFTVCGIELMIRENGIRGANILSAPGQLIPFLIGVSTLAKLIYIVYLDDFKLPPLIWGFSFGIESLMIPQPRQYQQSAQSNP